MRSTVKVEGLRELEQALSQFNERKRRAIGRKALDEGGEILARAARMNAPRDDGHMAESIDVSGTLSGRQKGLRSKLADQERFVGPGTHPQAHLREFGGDGNPPHPFMRPAWDATQRQVLKRIEDELWLGISRAAQAAARRAARLAAK